MAPLRRRPFWWHWEVELSTHVERRMARRARHKRRSWAVVVEPDVERTCVLVITAYPMDVE